MEIKKEDIMKMEMLLIEGIKKSDIGFLEKTIHDKVLFMAPNGQIITKEMDLASHKTGQMVIEKLSSTIEEINIIADTAISATIYDTKGKMQGTPIEGKFKYIRVWKKFDDGLKVIAASCFQIPSFK